MAIKLNYDPNIDNKKKQVYFIGAKKNQQCVDLIHLDTTELQKVVNFSQSFKRNIIMLI